MWKFIQENKIKDIRKENTFDLRFMIGEVFEDTEHTVEDYEQYNGEFVLKNEVPIEYQNEQIRQQRQARFVAEADPLRLDWDESAARGEEQAEEKKQIWLAKKDQIREELPYITIENTEEESSDSEETGSEE